MPQKSTLAKAAPKQATGAAAYLELVDQGVLWTAPSGAVIRVREISVLDRATLLRLPTHLQQVVDDLIDQSDVLRDADNTDDISSDEKEALGRQLLDTLKGEGGTTRDALERQYELSVQLCVIGWIEPQVVPTEADITDPETQIPATRMAAGDRNGWFAHVFGGDAEAAAKLSPFPAKPE